VFRKPHLLLRSQVTIKYLFFVVLISQLAAITISALDFSSHEAIALLQESEDPKSKEGKNAFDTFEEDEFLVMHIPLVLFLFDRIPHTLYKEPFLNEVSYTLELPPPKVV